MSTSEPIIHKIRDERGNTAVLEHNGQFAAVWYNRRERSWVAHLSDEQGYHNDASASEYVYTQAEGMAAGRMLQGLDN